MKILVNISNHPSERWCESQRMGWDKILDVPFPEIDPNWDVNEVIHGPVTEIMLRLGEIARDYAGNELYLHIAGEWTTVYLVLEVLREAAQFGEDWRLVWPASSRKVEEAVDPVSGATVKRAVFEFVRWREVPLCC